MLFPGSVWREMTFFPRRHFQEELSFQPCLCKVYSRRLYPVTHPSGRIIWQRDSLRWENKGSSSGIVGFLGQVLSEHVAFGSLLLASEMHFPRCWRRESSGGLRPSLHRRSLVLTTAQASAHPVRSRCVHDAAASSPRPPRGRRTCRASEEGRTPGGPGLVNLAQWNASRTASVALKPPWICLDPYLPSQKQTYRTPAPTEQFSADLISNGVNPPTVTPSLSKS